MLSSKEALKCIILGTNVDTHRSSIEEIDEAIETIEKDLEILEIIKKHKLLNYVLKNEKCAKIQSNATIYHQAGDSIVVTVLIAIFGKLLGIDYEKVIKEYVKGEILNENL